MSNDPQHGLPLMHGLPGPQRFELVRGTTYADGCVSPVLRPGSFRKP